MSTKKNTLKYITNKDHTKGLFKSFQKIIFFPVSKHSIAMQNILLFRGMLPILKNSFKEYFLFLYLKCIEAKHGYAQRKF